MPSASTNDNPSTPRKRLLIAIPLEERARLHEHIEGAIKEAIKIQNAVASASSFIRRIESPGWVVEEHGSEVLYCLIEERPESDDFENLLPQIRNKPLPVGLVASVGVQLCDALASSSYPAKGTKTPHGSLRASCISILNQRVQVSDIGVANSLRKLPALGERVALELLDHIAPYTAREVWMNPGSFGEPQDVFALGVLLFELATGQHPFGISNREDKEDCERRLTFRLPSKTVDANKTLPAKFAEVLDRAVQRLEQHRIRSFAALRESLATFLEPNPFAELGAEFERGDVPKNRKQLDELGARITVARSFAIFPSDIKVLESWESRLHTWSEEIGLREKIGSKLEAFENLIRRDPLGDFDSLLTELDALDPKSASDRTGRLEKARIEKLRREIEIAAKREPVDVVELDRVVAAIEQHARNKFAVNRLDELAEAKTKSVIELFFQRQVALVRGHLDGESPDAAQGVIDKLKSSPRILGRYQQNLADLENEIQKIRTTKADQEANQGKRKEQERRVVEGAGRYIAHWVKARAIETFSAYLQEVDAEVVEVGPMDASSETSRTRSVQISVRLPGSSDDATSMEVELTIVDNGSGDPSFTIESRAADEIDSTLQQLVSRRQHAELNKFIERLRNGHFPVASLVGDPGEIPAKRINPTVALFESGESKIRKTVPLDWNPAQLRWNCDQMGGQAITDGVTEHLVGNWQALASSSLKRIQLGDAALSSRVLSATVWDEGLDALRLELEWTLVGEVASLLSTSQRSGQMQLAYPGVDWTEPARSIDLLVKAILPPLGALQEKQIAQLKAEIAEHPTVRAHGGTVVVPPQENTKVLRDLNIMLTAPRVKPERFVARWDSARLVFVKEPSWEQKLERWPRRPIWHALFQRVAANLKDNPLVARAFLGVMIVASLALVVAKWISRDRNIAEEIRKWLVDTNKGLGAVPDWAVTCDDERPQDCILIREVQPHSQHAAATLVEIKSFGLETFTVSVACDKREEFEQCEKLARGLDQVEISLDDLRVRLAKNAEEWKREQLPAFAKSVVGVFADQPQLTGWVPSVVLDTDGLRILVRDEWLIGDADLVFQPKWRNRLWHVPKDFQKQIEDAAIKAKSLLTKGLREHLKNSWSGHSEGGSVTLSELIQQEDVTVDLPSCGDFAFTGGVWNATCNVVVKLQDEVASDGEPGAKTNEDPQRSTFRFDKSGLQKGSAGIGVLVAAKLRELQEKRAGDLRGFISGAFPDATSGYENLEDARKSLPAKSSQVVFWPFGGKPGGAPRFAPGSFETHSFETPADWDPAFRHWTPEWEQLESGLGNATAALAKSLIEGNELRSWATLGNRVSVQPSPIDGKVTKVVVELEVKWNPAYPKIGDDFVASLPTLKDWESLHLYFPEVLLSGLDLGANVLNKLVETRKANATEAVKQLVKGICPDSEGVNFTTGDDQIEATNSLGGRAVSFPWNPADGTYGAADLTAKAIRAALCPFDEEAFRDALQLLRANPRELFPKVWEAQPEFIAVCFDDPQIVSTGPGENQIIEVTASVKARYCIGEAKGPGTSLRSELLDIAELNNGLKPIENSRARGEFDFDPSGKTVTVKTANSEPAKGAVDAKRFDDLLSKRGLAENALKHELEALSNPQEGTKLKPGKATELLKLVWEAKGLLEAPNKTWPNELSGVTNNLQKRQRQSRGTGIEPTVLCEVFAGFEDAYAIFWSATADYSTEVESRRTSSIKDGPYLHRIGKTSELMRRPGAGEIQASIMLKRLTGQLSKAFEGGSTYGDSLGVTIAIDPLLDTDDFRKQVLNETVDPSKTTVLSLRDRGVGLGGTEQLNWTFLSDLERKLEGRNPRLRAHIDVKRHFLLVADDPDFGILQAHKLIGEAINNRSDQ